MATPYYSNTHRTMASTAMLAAFALADTVPMPAERDDSPKGIAEPVRNHSGPRVGRNGPCPCGSGKKSKKCCRGTLQRQ